MPKLGGSHMLFDGKKLSKKEEGKRE